LAVSSPAQAVPFEARGEDHGRRKHPGEREPGAALLWQNPRLLALEVTMKRAPFLPLAGLLLSAALAVPATAEIYAFSRRRVRRRLLEALSSAA
jgi:hypothetical protein